jgi:hypothetical protein
VKYLTQILITIVLLGVIFFDEWTIRQQKTLIKIQNQAIEELLRDKAAGIEEQIKCVKELNNCKTSLKVLGDTFDSLYDTFDGLLPPDDDYQHGWQGPGEIDDIDKQEI